jgi:hypothetical protein
MNASGGDWPQDGADIQAQVEVLEAELKAHPGYEAKIRWDELTRSWNVFGQTMQELVLLLIYGETDEDMIVELFQNVHPPAKRDAYLHTLDVKLESATAALSALVDVSTHILRDNYSGTDFYQQFVDRNKKIVTKEAVFLGNLRNYFQHYLHAPWQWTVHLGDGQKKSSAEINLETGELLKWSGWSAATKTYLSLNSPHLRLGPILSGYLKSMQELWTWLFEQYEALHGTDVDEMNALVRRINLTMSGGTLDGSNMSGYLRLVQENLNRSKAGEEQLNWQDVKDQPEYRAS